MIVKSGNGYKVVSHTTGRSFGKYRSVNAAKKRLRQIQMFKHMKKG